MKGLNINILNFEVQYYCFLVNLSFFYLGRSITLHTRTDLSLHSEEYVKALADKRAAKSINVELQGSWTVSVGDQDQCVHLWKYAGGYNAIDSATKLMNTDAVSTTNAFTEAAAIHGHQ